MANFKEYRPPIASKRAALSAEDEVAQIIAEERSRPGSPWPTSFLDSIGALDPSFERPTQQPARPLPDFT